MAVVGVVDQTVASSAGCWWPNAEAVHAAAVRRGRGELLHNFFCLCFPVVLALLCSAFAMPSLCSEHAIAVF